MPFIRHTRDKRGYDTTFVLHGYRPAQGPQRTRVLYLFRSPAHLKVGRQPLDEESREALEHTHPDISFDWSTLARESTVRIEETRERPPSRSQRSSGAGAPVPQRPAPQPTTPVPDDSSTLGRALGAERAARLRGRYAELLQRIVRRARTPEERDRLTGLADRLNPDDWPDEAVVRRQADGAEAEWEALVATLPARRRGRRGGRRRDGRPEDGGDTDPADQPSAIMANDGEAHASPEEPPHQNDPMDHADQPAHDRADDRAVGPEPGDRPAGDGLPGDD